MSTVTPDTESHTTAGRKPRKTRAHALDCAGFELMLAEVLDRDQLPLSALLHLETCAACTNVLETFEDLAAQVRQLPPLAPEPATDLWPHIAAQLRAEGVIHADEQECRAAMSPPQPTPQSAPHLVHRGGHR